MAPALTRPKHASSASNDALYRPVVFDDDASHILAPSPSARFNKYQQAPPASAAGPAMRPLPALLPALICALLHPLLHALLRALVREPSSMPCSMQSSRILFPAYIGLNSCSDLRLLRLALQDPVQRARGDVPKSVNRYNITALKMGPQAH